MTADDTYIGGHAIARGSLPRVAVVGAGMAGLVCAHALREAGFLVSVLERAARVGGRQSSRIESLADGAFSFDHGAQYFTISDPGFEHFLASYAELDPPLYREWAVPFVVLDHGVRRGPAGRTRRYVFTPTMAALTERLAEEIDVRLDCRVRSAQRRAGSWVLQDDAGAVAAEVEVLVLATPTPQALEILPEDAPLREPLAGVRYSPTWTLLVHFESSLEQPFGGAFVDNSPLAWVADNDTKPGRPAGRGENWILHATPEWSQIHIDADESFVAEALLGALAEALGRRLPPVTWSRPHRWRHALPVQSLRLPCLWDANARLGLAGDAFPEGGRIEGAYISGIDLARRIDRDLSERV